MRVRVVDDSPDLLVLCDAFLTSCGHDVETVGDNFERLLHIDRWDGIDAAILDVMLGGTLTGRDIAEWLEAHVPRVRRVILSAVGALRTDLEEVAHVVLTKPASPSEIDWAVRGAGHA